MWYEENIKIPKNTDMDMVDAYYVVKVFTKGSKFGIGNGRIHKLCIKIDGKITARYDRGWDIMPAEDDMATQNLITFLMLTYS
ncbi:DUF7678 domain-containing protein [Eubacterium ramulus]|uniref:DUF7678 domain-containing protein n=1 Tax=Eubacterium ramulus TaxID=39490 RepID=UPI0022E87464|nr:hypothetical protein [Eubacterium ramulus]